MINLCVSRLGRPDRLFCYGTLCLPEIMRSVCGGLPEALPAHLMDYACYVLTGRLYPAIVPAKGESVGGVLYTGVRQAQFARLDTYEGGEYRRSQVWLETGGDRLRAWTYVLRPRYYHRLSRRRWSPEQFRREQLKFYIANRHYTHYGLHGRDAT